MDRKTILELIRKVKKLADKGVEGEAESAKLKLKYLYQKYNLSDDDFIELQESYNRYIIIRHSFDRQLVSNLACMILNTSTFICGENNNVLRIKMTDDQYVDFLDAYEYYKSMFDEYSKYLMQAIISRNGIGYIPKTTPSAESSSAPSPTNEPPSNTVPEFDMIKLMKIAVAIDSSPWHKTQGHKNLPTTTFFDSVVGSKDAETGNNFTST